MACGRELSAYDVTGHDCAEGLSSMPAAPCGACGQPGARLSSGNVLCRVCYEAGMWEVACLQATKPEGNPVWPGWRL